MNLSASTLKIWMACALQAKFAKIDKLPQVQNAKASFGVCIHRSLELYNHTGDVDLAIKTFEDNWAHPEKLGVVPQKWPKFTSYEGLKQRGVELLRAYHDNLKWDGREVLFTEHRFMVPFGRHNLTGVVDLGEIRVNGKGKPLLRIIDYKTSTHAPTRAALALDIQFTIYTYASMQREFWEGNGPDYPGLPNGGFLFDLYKDMPRRAIWWHLWTGKEIDAGPRDEEDFLRLYRLVTEVEKAMERQVFVPRIGDACGLCSYTDQCNLRIPTRGEELEDEDVWI